MKIVPTIALSVVACWSSVCEAQTMPTNWRQDSVEDIDPQQMKQQLEALQREVQQLKQQQLDSRPSTPTNEASAGPNGSSNAASNCGCPVNACSCECPPEPSACIECPRVSTLAPYFNVNIFGFLKADMLYSSARPVTPGTPYFLAPGTLPGFDEATFDLHARQSTIGAVLTGPRIGNFQAGGQFVTTFFNDNVLADQYGVLPLQAWGELKNESWRFAAGLQFDVFNPGLPTILPFSALSGSGNSGNAFRGQVRLERFLATSDQSQWTIQAALSEPTVTTVNPTLGINEDAGWPNVETRIGLGLGALDPSNPASVRPFEIGVSSVVGQTRTTIPTVIQVTNNVWGVGCDLRWRFSPCWGLAGEFYTGQGLGTYNGGALQNTNADTLGTIRSTGGWLEVYRYFTPCLHAHIGAGIDDPLDRDVAVSAGSLGRVRNETYFANLIWDISNSYRIACEATWRETHYRSLLDNEGFGLQTQFQWSF